MKGGDCVLRLVVLFVLFRHLYARTNVMVDSDGILIPLQKPFATSNATLNIDIHCEMKDHNEKFHLAIYNYEQWDMVEQHTWNTDTVCYFPSYKRYEFTSDLSVEVNINKLSRYEVAILNCKARSILCQGETTWKMYSGGYLSMEELPELFVAAFLTFAFLIAALYWTFAFFYFVKTTEGRKKPIFGKIIISILYSKAVAEFALSLYYALYFFGSTYIILRIIAQALKVVSQLQFILMILMGSMGWGITRRALGLKERQLFWGTFLVYSIFLSLYEFCEGPATLCYAYLLSLQVMRGLLTFGTGLALGVNIAQLYANVDNICDPKTRPELLAKLNLLLKQRLLFPVWLLIPVFEILLGYVVMEWYNTWILGTVSDFMLLLLTISLASACNKIIVREEEEEANAQGTAEGEAATDGLFFDAHDVNSSPDNM
eukprot:CAMPEP_0174275260 /NCGR_PEP_ID=MMETSP0439-20130205/59727_1 /TAXON_ID=0 /ORGANISM="Stereomyxa ramosa, Strain Chinc5" /LENGTH=429 /DNA_ID=CAMNT_0015367345 /DNA_START=125 /DNA_END=1414 /DNA_ORIENTATION=+